MTPDYRAWFSKADMRVRFALPPSRPLQENTTTSELLPGGVSVQLHIPDVGTAIRSRQQAVTVGGATRSDPGGAGGARPLFFCTF